LIPFVAYADAYALLPEADVAAFTVPLDEEDEVDEMEDEPLDEEDEVAEMDAYALLPDTDVVPIIDEPVDEEDDEAKREAKEDEL
jgi:hypothetical protein